jgi:hypothetical protein
VPDFNAADIGSEGATTALAQGLPVKNDRADEPSAEKGSLDREAKLKVFADLLVLRFFSAAPGLVTFMINSGVVDDAIEFSFWRLPKELIEGVVKLSGCAKVEIFKFYRHDAPCTGFRFHPTDEDLSELEVAPQEEGEHAAEGHEDDQGADRPAPGAAGRVV